MWCVAGILFSPIRERPKSGLADVAVCYLVSAGATLFVAVGSSSKFVVRKVASHVKRWLVSTHLRCVGVCFRRSTPSFCEDSKQCSVTFHWRWRYKCCKKLRGLNIIDRCEICYDITLKLPSMLGHFILLRKQ